MNGVDTLIICDGGRKDGYGFDAAYRVVNGLPIIGYSIKAGVESRHIKKIYLYSDLVEKAFQIARERYPDDQILRILRADEPMPVPGPNQKILRIVPAEKRLVMSISKTFYKYIINDMPQLPPFAGDWKSADDINRYQHQNPAIQEIPIIFMGNDQPLCRAADLDDLIEAYHYDSYDSLIGYTKQHVLKGFLQQTGIHIDDLHYTLRKNDFINGEWMRHNCLFVLKWGKMDRRLIEVISFYNQHRVQSKFINFISVLLKIIREYYGVGRDVVRILLLGCLFGLGKYFNNFHSPLLRRLVINYLNNPKILKFTQRLGGHSIALYDQGTARPVIDVDDPKDIAVVQKLLQMDKIDKDKDAPLNN